MDFEDREESDGMEMLSSSRLGHAEIDLIPGMAAMNLMESFPVLITGETFREMGQPLKSLIDVGGVCAIQQNGRGARRYARVSLSPDHCKLYLHHLQEEPPLSPNTCLVEHSDMLQVLDSSTKVAFMELGMNGSSLGKMQIRLLQDAGASQQFCLLCSAEVGPSYANTRLLEVWEKDMEKEYVTCGDYELNTGLGGRAIVPRLGDLEEYNKPWHAGTVFGFLLWKRVAGQFCILTKNNPDMVLSAPAFGMVEEGLNILVNAIKFSSNIRDVFIIDCGMVMTCPR
ncbi:uncharacterized protein [Palaemon carinicauda]|uniref:uncharacterized protein n=1 Tax=Palaemon carinicauda TaxID=392227 RepID=UPI0035B6069F